MKTKNKTDFSHRKNKCKLLGNVMININILLTLNKNLI